MRELRAERGLSQEAFADHCGLHRTAVGLIERGHRVPSLKTLLAISAGFGISLSDLLRSVDNGYKKR
jgi:transcriptional regulator with XRE-family HTH domain